MEEYTVKGNDFSRWDSIEALKLERTDRNGTRYYTSNVCPRCGGTGKLPEFIHIEEGECFRCKGSGVSRTEYKVMTQAYAEKINAKRLEKARQGAAEKNAEFLEKTGFSADGRAWIVLGNTYEIREELKEAGAKFSRMLGWAFPFEQSKYDTLEISKDTEIEEEYSEYLKDCIEDDEYRARTEHDTLIQENWNGVYEFTNSADIEGWLKDKKHERELELKAERGEASEYVGEVGKKITAKVTVEKVHWYETHYGYYGGSSTIYTMTDADGNRLIWKTGAGFDDPVKAGTELTISGTVKAHSEYNGEKQTELTRVKALETEKAEKKENRPEENAEPYNDEAEKAIVELLRNFDEAV